MINCDKARDLANGYIDNVLSEAESTAYEEHISCCEACHEEYDILRQIASDLSKTAVPLPDGFKNRMHSALVSNLPEHKNESKKKKLVFPYYRTASVMAAALVIAVVGKYGIYDTYKNVSDDVKNTAVQNELGSSKGENVQSVTPKTGSAPDAALNDEAVKEAQTADAEEAKNAVESSAVNKKVNKPQEKVIRSERRVQDTPQSEPENAPAPVEAVPAPAADLSTSTAAPVTESAPAPASAAVEGNTEGTAPSDGEAVMARMMPMQEENTSDANFDTTDEVGLTADTDEEADSSASDEPTVSSGGGGGGSSAKTAETAPVAAQVSISDSGDGNKITFKKYLYTIVDGSQITETEDEITITVNEEEYDTVMEHIRSNEYVKEVTDGTAADGKVIINIK